MAQRGKRLYQCDECKHKAYHHWIEKNRAARMRCPACGSARLELVSQEAKEEQADLCDVARFGHRDMVDAKTHRPKK